MNYPIIEGMALRKDKGHIRPYATVLFVLCAIMFLALGSTVRKVLSAILCSVCYNLSV